MGNRAARSRRTKKPHNASGNAKSTSKSEVWDGSAIATDPMDHPEIPEERFVEATTVPKDAVSVARTAWTNTIIVVAVAMMMMAMVIVSISPPMMVFVMVAVRGRIMLLVQMEDIVVAPIKLI